MQGSRAISVEVKRVVFVWPSSFSKLQPMMLVAGSRADLLRGASHVDGTLARLRATPLAPHFTCSPLTFPRHPHLIAGEGGGHRFYTGLGVLMKPCEGVRRRDERK